MDFRVDKPTEEKAGGAQGVKTYTPLQSFSLTRLSGMVARLHEYQASPHREERLVTTLKRAIYSTLRDCDELGVGEEARQALHRDHPRS